MEYQHEKLTNNFIAVFIITEVGIERPLHFGNFYILFLSIYNYSYTEKILLYIISNYNY